jgi:hypothetical protein
MNTIDLTEAQAAFVRELPDMLKIALWQFRGLDAEKREDRTWAAIGLVWRYWLPLYEQGHGDMLRPCLSFAIRQARAGRDVSRARRVPAVLVLPWEGVAHDVVSDHLSPAAEVQPRLDLRAWWDSLAPSMPSWPPAWAAGRRPSMSPATWASARGESASGEAP